MASVAVVGAGLAGLTAAHALRRRGYDVCVYEAGPRSGGVIDSRSERGFLADLGPNSMLSPPPLVAAVLRELGLLEQRIEASPAARRRYVVRNGRPVPIPASPREFLASPLFSLGAKLRIMTEPLRRRSAGMGEESLAGLVRRRMGQEVVSYALDPVVAGVYAGDPERLSALHAMPSIGALESRYGSLVGGTIRMMKERHQGANAPEGRMFSFPDGMGAIPRALTASVGDALLLGTAVTRLARVGAHWLVRSSRGTAQYDAVIAAAPAHALARLEFDGQDQSSWAALGKIEYAPVAVVVSGFARADVAHPLDGFGVLVPAIERRHTLGTLFSSSLFPGRAPRGFVTLTTFVGGARQPGLALAGDASITAAVDADLRDLLGVRGTPVFRLLHRYQQGIPQYNCGHGDIASAMDRLEDRNRGLFLAGNFRNGVSVADVMTSGALAAQEAMALIDPASLIAAEMAG